MLEITPPVIMVLLAPYFVSITLLMTPLFEYKQASL